MGPSCTSTAPSRTRHFTSSASPATARPSDRRAPAVSTAGTSASMVAVTATRPIRAFPSAAAASSPRLPTPNASAARATSGWSTAQAGYGEACPATASFRV